MSLNNSGEFNNFVLNKGSNIPSVPQNTPAYSSFSDRMMVQMNLKNLRHPEGISLSEKDAVFRNLSSRLMALNPSDPSGADSNGKVITREEAMLELQRTRLGYLITHLERINLIESEREAELETITLLQKRLISGEHVDFGSSGPVVEEGSIKDFWPTVLENVSLPCVGNVELNLFKYVTDVTCEYLPANIEGLKTFLAKICDDSSKSSEWPTCEGFPGSYGYGTRITFHLKENNIIECPGNRLSIEIRYDIEIPNVVAHIACSSFTKLEGAIASEETNNNKAGNEEEEDDVTDLGLLDLMEPFSKGIDITAIRDGEGDTEFFQEASEQLSGFCDAIKARVIPYASQMYFDASSEAKTGENDW